MSLVGAVSIIAGLASLLVAIVSNLLNPNQRNEKKENISIAKESLPKLEQAQRSSQEIEHIVQIRKRALKRLCTVVLITGIYLVISAGLLFIPRSHTPPRWPDRLLRITSISVGALAIITASASAIEAYVNLKADQEQIERKIREVHELVGH